MERMNATGAVYTPAGGKTKAYHDRKYRVFHQLHEDFVAYRELMD